jgi:hypothetical protein
MIYAIYFVLHLDFNSRSLRRLYLLGIPYLIPIEICRLLSILKLQLRNYFVKKCPKTFEVGARYPSVLHTRLRLGNSTLNDDLFRHNCKSSPTCACACHRETTENYLLHCPLWDTYRSIFLTTAAECLGNYWFNSNRTGKLSFLHSGCNNVAFNVNHRLFFAVQRFIIDTYHYYCKYLFNRNKLSEVLQNSRCLCF